MGEVLFLCWHRVQEGVGPVPFAERRRGSGVFRERSMKASDGLSCGAARFRVECESGPTCLLRKRCEPSFPSAFVGYHDAKTR